MKMSNREKNNSTEIPQHAYILWDTGEVLDFNMKGAAQKLGIGSTAFKTNLRNRFVCKVNVVKFIDRLKNMQDNECPECLNSENYESKTRVIQ
jgi:hypothetical protein